MKKLFEDGGNEAADIAAYKRKLISSAKAKGLRENFGQKEVRALQDKYGRTAGVAAFDEWVMNFDLSQIKESKLPMIHLHLFEDFAMETAKSNSKKKPSESWKAKFAKYLDKRKDLIDLGEDITKNDVEDSVSAFFDEHGRKDSGEHLDMCNFAAEHLGADWDELSGETPDDKGPTKFDKMREVMKKDKRIQDRIRKKWSKRDRA